MCNGLDMIGIGVGINSSSIVMYRKHEVNDWVVGRIDGRLGA